LIETVNDLSSIRNLLDDQQKESETLLLQHARISNDLQDGLLRTRMVPFSQLAPRLLRLVRQTAGSLNKRAMLEVIGGEGEMDRSILDRMLAPMEHILRNAVSHGIETAEVRRAAGKDETGRITIYLNREGNDVVITVSDDGAGLNLDAIRRRAIERGLLEPGAKIKDDDVMQLVLEPGFSTVKEVTQISGRGVGTDVVVSEVKQMGGSLEIDSQPGRGTSFSIRLPFTLAISEALLVELGDEVFAVPHPTIEGVVRINIAELTRCYEGKQASFQYAGHDYQVRYLGNLLGTLGANIADGRKWLPLMLVRSGEHRVAIQVDRILGNRQIVVKSVGVQLSSVRWISGGTILADGRVALILDVSALVRMDVVHSTSSIADMLQSKAEQQVKVMVVDDSITVRKVTTRLLKRHNMEVITAKDGVDAVAQLQEQKPDVMLLDIEMPRMDGYELARHMRNSGELSDIPIIMITSRTGDKHRNLALSLGVKRYLGKPYQETDLLDNIYAILAESEVGV
jgi:chemosensory pili system protein ChpA (sensor histidine kinase/response regulator)